MSCMDCRVICMLPSIQHIPLGLLHYSLINYHYVKAVTLLLAQNLKICSSAYLCFQNSTISMSVGSSTVFLQIKKHLTTFQFSLAFIPFLLLQQMRTFCFLEHDLSIWQFRYLQRFFYFQMIEPTDSLLFTPDIEALELQLQSVNTQMELLARAGKYILAETYKANAEKLKKDIDSKRIEEAQKRHCKENKEVKKYLKDDLAAFNIEWDNKLKQHVQLGKNLVSQLKAKHKKEETDERSRLQQQTFKGKESSQLLNLRVIQLNLAKQLNFVQAQKVQKQVKELEKKQQEGWQKLKQQKIEKEIEVLKGKQLAELRALQKKIASGKWQLQIERTKAQAILVLKHSVVVKELQSENKKESLALKGEFKSKGAMFSPGRSVLSPSKSRILSSTSQSKFLPTMTR